MSLPLSNATTVSMGMIVDMSDSRSCQPSSSRRSVGSILALYITSSYTKMRGFAGRARPWSEFVEIREYNLPRTSSMPHVAHNTSPPTLNAAVSRSYANWRLYSVNYAIAIILVSMAFIAYNPHSLLVLLVVGFLWSYVFIFRDNGRALTVLGMQLSGEQTTVVLGILSVMIIFFMSNTGHILLGVSIRLSLALFRFFPLCARFIFPSLLTHAYNFEVN